jgi:hypothetical protein
MTSTHQLQFAHARHHWRSLLDSDQSGAQYNIFEATEFHESCTFVASPLENMVQTNNRVFVHSHPGLIG